MNIVNIENRYTFKTKNLELNCYSINSSVWKYLDTLFLKSLWLNTEKLVLKDGICFIDVFTTIFSVEVLNIDGRKARNVKYLSVWHLIEYIEKYATIEQYQKLVLCLFQKEGI